MSKLPPTTLALDFPPPRIVVAFKFPAKVENVPQPGAAALQPLPVSFAYNSNERPPLAAAIPSAQSDASSSDHVSYGSQPGKP